MKIRDLRGFKLSDPLELIVKTEEEAKEIVEKAKAEAAEIKTKADRSYRERIENARKEALELRKKIIEDTKVRAKGKTQLLLEESENKLKSQGKEIETRINKAAGKIVELVLKPIFLGESLNETGDRNQ